MICECYGNAKIAMREKGKTVLIVIEVSGNKHLRTIQSRFQFSRNRLTTVIKKKRESFE